MKALVTGAGGFIGSHLTELLTERGFEVKALVRYNSQDRWGWLDYIKTDVEVIRGDVRDFDSVKKMIEDVDVVFHLAALIGIPYSYETPVAYIRTNVEGTYNVLEAAKMSGKISRIVHISSSEVYGTAQYIPIDEKHPYNPQSPYAATKAAADMLALTYYRSFDLPVTIVRPFNTFGPRQSLRAVIPTIITQAIKNGVVRLGNLSTKRDFLYVKDTVRGILEVGLHEKTIGDVFNIGTGKSFAISEVVDMVSKIHGKPVKVTKEEERIRPFKSEVEVLECNFEKANKLTGWKPHYSFKEALRETYLWFRENLDLYKNFEKYNV